MNNVDFLANVRALVLQRKYLIINLLVLISCLVSLMVLSLYGKSNRWYLKKPDLQVSGSPHLAFFTWRDNGVKGRVLFLFDRSIGISPMEDTLTPNNYIYKAMHFNLLRKVYQVVPDQSWEEVERALRNNPYAISADGVFRIPVEGVSVYVMRLRDVGIIKEKVLVTINADAWPASDLSSIADLLADRKIESDLVTIAGNPSQDILQKIDKVIHEIPKK